MTSRLLSALTAASVLAALAPVPHAQAQMGPSGPPSVGVVRVARKPVVESNEFIGRIQATNRVDLVARVTAFLEQQNFTEGAEVKRGDVLYKLEQGPFQADVQAKQGAVAQQLAQLQNATVTLGRAEALLNTPAGQRSNVDTATASQRSLAAQVLTAQANLRFSQINLDYTEIKAPIDGKIGRTNVTVGNVVSASSGTLATIVSQDPMWVAFPISVRTALELRQHYADKGGLDAVTIKVRLPDGRMYAQPGKLDFVNNTITQNTDTLTLRGTLANPQSPSGGRELVDGEFVTVVLEAVQPLQMLSVPRAAILSNQGGDFVYVVGPDNKVSQVKVQLGQTSPTDAVVLSGLQDGQMVISEGVQRAKPGIEVSPGPAGSSMPPGAPAGAPGAAGGAAPVQGAPPPPADAKGGNLPGGNAPGSPGGGVTPPAGSAPSSRS